MTCIPLSKLNGYLFTINPEKVRPDLRDKVIAYQEECHIALYNYWNKGAAINDHMLTEELERKIVDAVKDATSRREKTAKIKTQAVDQYEKMISDLRATKAHPTQIALKLKAIAEFANDGNLPDDYDVMDYACDFGTIFDLAYPAMRVLPNPVDPEVVKHIEQGYCKVARYFAPTMAKTLVRYLQLNGALPLEE